MSKRFIMPCWFCLRDFACALVSWQHYGSEFVLSVRFLALQFAASIAQNRIASNALQRRDNIFTRAAGVSVRPQKRCKISFGLKFWSVVEKQDRRRDLPSCVTLHEQENMREQKHMRAPVLHQLKTSIQTPDTTRKTQSQLRECSTAQRTSFHSWSCLDHSHRLTNKIFWNQKKEEKQTPPSVHPVLRHQPHSACLMQASQPAAVSVLQHVPFHNVKGQADVLESIWHLPVLPHHAQGGDREHDQQLEKSSQTGRSLRANWKHKSSQQIISKTGVLQMRQEQNLNTAPVSFVFHFKVWLSLRNRAFVPRNSAKTPPSATPYLPANDSNVGVNTNNRRIFEYVKMR